MKRVLTRAGAVLGAATLASMAVSPAIAAETVAQAEANALTLSIAGTGFGTGTVTATHDGDSLTRKGETQPPVSVLQGQGLLDVGVLAQDATAGVTDLDGVSDACAGVAGDGATLIEVGGSDCIDGGDNIELTLANLDLSDTVVFGEDSALATLNAVTDPALAALVAPATETLSSGLAAAVNDNLGEVAVGGTVGVIESWCGAGVGSARGGARIADAQIGITLAGEQVGIVDLPVEPAPDTQVVTELDAVVEAVVAGVEQDLATTLTGALGDLTAVTGAVEAQIIDPIVGELAPHLAPLEDELLRITLNKQSRPTADSIEVTAMDIQLLPAASEFVGASLISGRIAHVSCGPNGRLSVVQDEDPVPGGNAGGDLPNVPTVVDSGVSAEAGRSLADGLIGGSLVLAALAGLVGHRRSTAAK